MDYGGREQGPTRSKPPPRKTSAMHRLLLSVGRAMPFPISQRHLQTTGWEGENKASPSSKPHLWTSAMRAGMGTARPKPFTESARCADCGEREQVGTADPRPFQHGGWQSTNPPHTLQTIG